MTEIGNYPVKEKTISSYHAIFQAVFLHFGILYGILLILRKKRVPKIVRMLFCQISLTKLTLNILQSDWNPKQYGNMKAFSDKKRNGFFDLRLFKIRVKKTPRIESFFCKLTWTPPPPFQKSWTNFYSFSIFMYGRGGWKSLLFAGHKIG